MELSPRAAAITDLVLWIGICNGTCALGASNVPPEPVIKRFHNIEHRDALLAYDVVEPALDEHGNPLTIWDGQTMERHPVTREEVPDESARKPILAYRNPRRAEWPSTDFIVGNPPFLGNWRMRGALGHGYAETLRSVYGDMPETADLATFRRKIRLSGQRQTPTQLPSGC